MAKIKPTFKDPVSSHGEAFDKNFKKTMVTTSPEIATDVNINEANSMLTEVEQSLKKKIWSLAKMEALVFSDPKLSAVYEEMADNGEEKYGYHYNETIQNMIFNDYVLNSPQYLQKYKQAIPSDKKRRDKSGINQLKKKGKQDATGTKIKKTDPNKSDDKKKTPRKKLSQSGLDDDTKQIAAESTSAGSAGGAAGYTGYAGPAAFSTKGDLSGDMEKKGNTKAVPVSLKESNYLTDPSGFEDFYNMLEEGSSISSGDGSGYYESPVGFKDDIKNVSKQLDTDKELRDLEKVNTSLPGQEKRAYGKHLPSGKNVSSAVATPSPNTEVKKPHFKGGKIVSPFSTGNENVSGTIISKHNQPEKMNENFNNNVNNTETMNENNREIDPSYSHFAVFKNNGKIIEGWDYNGYDSDELKSDKEHYFKGDIRDRGYKPNSVNILTSKYLQRKGIDPYNMDNWLEIDYDAPYDENDPNLLEDTQTMIQDNGTSMSNKPQAMGDMSNEVPMGAQSSGGLQEGMENIDDIIRNITKDGSTLGKRFERFLRRYPEIAKHMSDDFDFQDERDIDLDADTNENVKGSSITYGREGTKIPNSQIREPQDANAWDDTSRVEYKPEMTKNDYSGKYDNESLFESLNKELEAFSTHHDKLKLMEDKKTPSMIQGDRLRTENPKNFKKDMKHSGTKDVINVEKELQWKDQQTEVKDGYKLGNDLEKQTIKNAAEAFDNVGNSANDKGNEITKRNLTDKEQDEVNMYRNGMHSLDYDNEPDKRFVDRMKADQGEFFEIGEKQKEFKAGAPMYNKDSQPVFDGDKKEQFNESMITGRYNDILGKNRLIEFRLGEAKSVDSINEDEYSELNFAGLGNTYHSKTVDGKVAVNENVVNVMESYKFYTDGVGILVTKNKTQNLSEGEVKETPALNEEMDKMKHLLGYKPDSFISTKGTKVNRGF